MIQESPTIELLALEVFYSGSWHLWTDALSVISLDRGGKTDGVTTSVEPALLSATLIDAGDPLTDATLKPNLPMRLRSVGGQPAFTGKLLDIDTKYGIDKATGRVHTYVTITGVDAVARHNTTRVVGAVSAGGVGYETWATRIARLAASSTESFSLPTDGADVVQYALAESLATVDGWAGFGALGANLVPSPPQGLVSRETGGAYITLSRALDSVGYTSTTIPGPAAYTTGIERTFTGLVIGHTYTLTGTCYSRSGPATNTRFQLVGGAAGASIAGAGTIPSLAFVATATTHTLQIASGTGNINSNGLYEYARYRSIKLTETPPAADYRLQDVALDSSLTEHFDVASATVGAAWWTDRNNVTQFREAESFDAVQGIFSDRRGTGLLEYVDIGASYDTRQLVNDLTTTNLGRSSVDGSAVDVERTRLSAASVTLWGDKPGDVSMSMREGYIDATNLVWNTSAKRNLTNLGRYGSNGTFARQVTGAQTYARCTATTTQTVGIALTTGTDHSGASGSNAFLAVVAGTRYYQKARIHTSGSGTVGMGMRWYNAANALLQTDLIAPAVPPFGTNILDMAMDIVAPATATKMIGFVTRACVVGEYIEVQRWIVSTTDIAFFDGDTADTESYVYDFAGAVDASAHTRKSYANRVERELAILARYDTPAVRVNWIRWNAQERPELGATLDIQTLIIVRFRAIEQRSRIVGIKHEISPKRWMMTMQLTKA